MLQRCAATRMLTGHPPHWLAAAAGPSWGGAGASGSHWGSEEGSTPLSWQSSLPPSCNGCLSGGQSAVADAAAVADAVTHTLTSSSDQISRQTVCAAGHGLHCSAVQGVCIRSSKSIQGISTC